LSASETREWHRRVDKAFPDFASLNPGYRQSRRPFRGGPPQTRNHFLTYFITRFGPTSAP
jgi:hypothetical protein